MTSPLSEFESNFDHEIGTYRSNMVAERFKNPVFVVTKQTAESGKMFFEVNVATASTQIDKEITTKVICDTGKACRIFTIYNLNHC